MMVEEIINQGKNQHETTLFHDGISHFKTSVLPNSNYSREILDDVDKITAESPLTKLVLPGNKDGKPDTKDLIQGVITDKISFEKLEDTDKPAFLNAAKVGIESLARNSERLKVHTQKHNTIILIMMGRLFHRVEKACDSKSEYTTWLNSLNLISQRMSQQAKQLASLGKFAEHYSSLGKTRLLDFYRVLKVTGSSSEELLKQFPFPDTVNDHDGVLSSRHADAIITFYRLRSAGVDCATFDNAQFIVSFKERRIKVAEAQRIKGAITSSTDERQAFDNMLDDMQITERQDTSPRRIPKSLDQIMSDFLAYISDTDLEDDAIINGLKGKVSINIVYKASHIMTKLAEKLKVKDAMLPMVVDNNIDQRGGAR